MTLSKLFVSVVTLPLVPCAGQQVINGSRTLLGGWDASGAATTKPVKTGSSLPGTCGVGELFFNTSAAPGTNLYFCAAANTWTQMQTSGTGAANYKQTFTNAASVVLTHNLNSTGVVFACYDNSTPPLWILPKSATLTDANDLSVTFAATQSGSCVVNATGAGTSYSASTGISIAGSSISVDRTVIPAYLAGSALLTFGAIPQAGCSQSTFSLTGVNPGDSIAPGWPATIEPGLTGTMIATAANTIAVRLCNLSGASVTPAAQTFRATVLH